MSQLICNNMCVVGCELPHGDDNMWGECNVVSASLSLVTPSKSLKTNVFLQVNDTASNIEGKNLYLPHLNYPEQVLENIIEYSLSNDCKIMAKLSQTLEEVGRMDSKHKLSPIMFLHSLGLMENATIVGGVYLDNDDVDLMVQENCSLVVTPSFTLGSGHGIPNVFSYLSRGLNISLGTGSNCFNKNFNMLSEAYLIYMATCAHMNRGGAISMQQLSKMLCGSVDNAEQLNKTLFSF